jgi:hypothetical protein
VALLLSSNFRVACGIRLRDALATPHISNVPGVLFRRFAAYVLAGTQAIPTIIWLNEYLELDTRVLSLKCAM